MFIPVGVAVSRVLADLTRRRHISGDERAGMVMLVFSETVDNRAVIAAHDFPNFKRRKFGECLADQYDYLIPSSNNTPIAEVAVDLGHRDLMSSANGCENLTDTDLWQWAVEAEGIDVDGRRERF